MKSTIECKDLNELTDTCTLYTCVKEVEGISVRDEFPTERWMIKFNDGTKYNGKPIKRNAFIKWWIDPSTITHVKESPHPPYLEVFSFKRHLALDYELKMYKYIIKPLVDYNVSPNFPSLLFTSKGCHINNLARMLLDNETKDNYDETISLSNIKYNIRRALHHMVNGIISENIPITIIWKAGEGEFVEEWWQVKPEPSWRYNMIVLEKGYMYRRRSSLEDWGGGLEKGEETIRFQIIATCYAMSAAGITHNNLAYDGGRIDDVPLTYIHYVYGDTVYSLRTREIFKCSEFSQAYSVALGDNPFLSDGCEGLVESKEGDWCNEYIPNKDVIIFFIHLMRYPGERDDMYYDIICPNEKAKTFLKGVIERFENVYYLVKPNGERLDKDDYSMFRTIDDMLKKAAKYSPGDVKTRPAKNLSEEFLSKSNVYVCNHSMFERGRLKRRDIRSKSAPK